eukprot:9486083-Alexandrium_andersonii.AAC.1
MVPGAVLIAHRGRRLLADVLLRPRGYSTHWPRRGAQTAHRARGPLPRSPPCRMAGGAARGWSRRPVIRWSASGTAPSG